MNIGILYGVAGGHHHAVSKVDAHMTFPRRIIRSYWQKYLSGFGRLSKRLEEEMSEKLDKLRASLEKERERRIKINTRIESLERQLQGRG